MICCPLNEYESLIPREYIQPKHKRKRQIIKCAGKYGKYYKGWLSAHKENADTQIPFPQMLDWYRRCKNVEANN